MEGIDSLFILQELGSVMGGVVVRERRGDWGDLCAVICKGGCSFLPQSMFLLK